MGRHSQPEHNDRHDGHGGYPGHDGHDRRSARPRPPRRARTVVGATAVLLTVVLGGLAYGQDTLLPLVRDCPQGDLRLDVVASPDVAPALKEIAARTGGEEVRVAGRCLDVAVKARPSAEVADSLRRGGGGFHVWVADSSVWPKSVQSALGDSDLQPLGHIASSPLTLAAVQPAAEALGWPRRTYGWAELAQAGAGGGAASFDVGAADPARSATALLALQYIHASSARASDESTAATLTASAAKELAKRIQPGDETVLAALPRDRSPVERASSSEALLLSEQAAFTHNRRHPAGDEAHLSLFYPKDGAGALDYPYHLLNTARLDTDRQVAADRFLTLLNDDEGRAVLRRHGFRDDRGTPDEDLVRAAGGRAPQPFGEKPAAVPDAGTMAAVLSMWTITIQPARLTAVVDASGSMAFDVPSRPGETRMDVTRGALMQALPQFTDEDEIGLWRFATPPGSTRDYQVLVKPQRLGERSSGGMTQRERLTRAFGSLRPVVDGSTRLYDTTLAAYRSAVETYVPGKFNALVVLTDGADDDSGRIGLTGLTKQLSELADHERPVGLIVIAAGPDADAAACAKIAKAVGGASYAVKDPAEVHRVLLQSVMDAGAAAARR
ncbi:substrate-binding domain-containing protein [Streptomyces polyrhachis]|uniref:Substrate-binding domain-containing protein n=1 Tax=Streptomyces polyrhachis TaxID=1282885 RepID=A0ABW2GB85_9ACTN